ncbi:hypothetical protein EZV73_14700 [Acidaminobacter sp. JC074]|uniref:hypothetical protein n=1 Tax=Acidaminobacter sp. JC074 TaxID=2530199 RepID=UPI001F0D598C|nr:hypothetical protein [Acidaminobacter sp. JC074]MCH4888842.1 hypothetical protein [Acidaminobacter sp. JC074]
MKKTVYIIIGILSLLLLVMGSNYSKLQNNQTILRNRVYELEQAHAEIKSGLRVNETSNQNLQEENDNYKLIVKRLLEHEHYSDLSKIIRKTYDVKSLVTTDDASFEVPRNGKIIVDSESLAIEINIELPPDFDEEFNDMLHLYDRFNFGLMLDKELTSDYQVDKKRIYIEYDKLEADDRIDIYVSNELQTLLGLSDRHIEIINRQTESSEAYLEKNLSLKEFGGFITGVYSHKFDYDNKTVIQSVDRGPNVFFNLDYEGAQSIDYKFDRGIKVISKRIGSQEEYFDFLILPEQLKLGQEWTNRRRCVLSALDYQLETAIGVLDTIEVSHFENGFLVFKKYYARNLGLVATDYGNGWDKIIKIDYTK